MFESLLDATDDRNLLTADSDRLWILSRASRVGDGRKCTDLYLRPDDPRYQGLTQQCDSWTRDYADYLRLNGFPTIGYAHFQEPVYWEWYLDKRQQISDCVTGTADSDRLWILSRASRVGDGRKCTDLYLRPDDPRYQGLTQQCDSWTRDYADYLRLNGFPTIGYAHFQEPVYWEWYLDKRQQISDCVTAIGSVSLTATSAERAEHTRRRRACDPYDDAMYNEKRSTTNDLGIRYP